MFKLNAAHRLSADDVADHRDEDELATQDFLNTTTAADTLESRDSRDLVPYMFARKLAATLRAQTEHNSAMGDNQAETDPLMQNYENTNPRYKSGIASSSTSDTPFDDFGNMETPSEMYLEDQPDTVRAARHKKKPHTKHKPKTPHKHKKSKPTEMLDRLLDEDLVMYQTEAEVEEAKSTYDFDFEPGSVDVRFPVSPGPVDGQTYMNATRRLNAGFDQEEENPEVLGEPSEDGEVQILSSGDAVEADEADENEEQEVLGDADPKVLWNVANQPLS